MPGNHVHSRIQISQELKERILTGFHLRVWKEVFATRNNENSADIRLKDYTCEFFSRVKIRFLEIAKISFFRSRMIGRFLRGAHLPSQVQSIYAHPHPRRACWLAVRSKAFGPKTDIP